MRLHHRQCRTRQVGRVLAPDVRRRHQADWADGLRHHRGTGPAKQDAFSPLMFVAVTKLMVPKASGITAVTDLKGKTVVVTKGTTNEQAMHNADKKFLLALNIVTAPDHEQSYQMLSDGKA